MKHANSATINAAGGASSAGSSHLNEPSKALIKQRSKIVGKELLRASKKRTRTHSSIIKDGSHQEKDGSSKASGKQPSKKVGIEERDSSPAAKAAGLSNNNRR